MNTIPNLIEVSDAFAARIDAVILPSPETVLIAAVAVAVVSIIARIVANEISFRNN